MADVCFSFPPGPAATFLSAIFGQHPSGTKKFDGNVFPPLGTVSSTPPSTVPSTAPPSPDRVSPSHSAASSTLIEDMPSLHPSAVLQHVLPLPFASTESGNEDLHRRLSAPMAVTLPTTYEQGPSSCASASGVDGCCYNCYDQNATMEFVELFDPKSGPDLVLVVSQADGGYLHYRVPRRFFGSTKYLRVFMKPGMPLKPLTFDSGEICRRHTRGSCDRKSQCKFLHVCRNVWGPAGPKERAGIPPPVFTRRGPNSPNAGRTATATLGTLYEPADLTSGFSPHAKPAHVASVFTSELTTPNGNSHSGARQRHRHALLPKVADWFHDPRHGQPQYQRPQPHQNNATSQPNQFQANDQAHRVVPTIAAANELLPPHVADVLVPKTSVVMGGSVPPPNSVSTQQTPLLNQPSAPLIAPATASVPSLTFPSSPEYPPAPTSCPLPRSPLAGLTTETLMATLAREPQAAAQLNKFIETFLECCKRHDLAQQAQPHAHVSVTTMASASPDVTAPFPSPVPPPHFSGPAAAAIPPTLRQTATTPSLIPSPSHVSAPVPRYLTTAAANSTHNQSHHTTAFPTTVHKNIHPAGAALGASAPKPSNVAPIVPPTARSPVVAHTSSPPLPPSPSTKMATSTLAALHKFCLVHASGSAPPTAIERLSD